MRSQGCLIDAVENLQSTHKPPDYEPKNKVFTDHYPKGRRKPHFPCEKVLISKRFQVLTNTYNITDLFTRT